MLVLDSGVIVYVKSALTTLKATDRNDIMIKLMQSSVNMYERERRRRNELAADFIMHFLISLFLINLSIII
jgi:hypothetical protein